MAAPASPSHRGGGRERNLQKSGSAGRRAENEKNKCKLGSGPSKKGMKEYCRGGVYGFIEDKREEPSLGNLMSRDRGGVREL